VGVGVRVAPHLVVVAIAILVNANVILPYPKLLDSYFTDAKFEGKAAWTNFTLIFAVIHRLAFRRHLQFRLVILDRSAPKFGMELREGFVICQLNPRSAGLHAEDIIIRWFRGRHWGCD
jgi:hypothetical protein